MPKLLVHALPRRDEVVQKVEDPSAAMHLQPEDHVHDAADRGPRPNITAQVIGDRVPVAEQEVGRADEERQGEEPKGDIAGGDGELP